MQVLRRYRLGPTPHHAENRCNTLITFDKSHLATHECTAYTEDGASRSATTDLLKGMPCVPHMDGIVVRAAVRLVAVVQALQIELTPGHTAASVDAVEIQLRTALEPLAERAGLARERSRLAEHDRPDSSECGERQRGADRTGLFDRITTVHGLSSGRCRAHRHTDFGAVRGHAAGSSSRHSALAVRSMSSVERKRDWRACRTNRSTAARKVRTRCASVPTPINCAPSVLRARSAAEGDSRPSEALWTRSSPQAMCRQVPSIVASVRNATVNTAPLTPSLRSAARMSPP